MEAGRESGSLVVSAAFVRRQGKRQESSASVWHCCLLLLRAECGVVTVLCCVVLYVSELWQVVGGVNRRRTRVDGQVHVRLLVLYVHLYQYCRRVLLLYTHHSQAALLSIPINLYWAVVVFSKGKGRVVLVAFLRIRSA